MFLRVSLAAILAAFAISGPPGPAAAQTYPNRPITLVIPFAARRLDDRSWAAPSPTR